MRTSSLALSLASLPLLGLCACTVGPNYAGPAATGAITPPAAFARTPGAADAALSVDSPVAASWWKTMGDPTLDDLQERALAANPSVAIAQARVRQARAGLRSERANGAPSVNAQALYAHATVPGVNLGSSDEGDSSGGSGSQSINLYNLGFDASWEVDLWGGKRRGVEAARAQAEAADANLADAQVSLTAEVAQAYVNLRDRQQRIAFGTQDIERQRQTLALTEQRRAAGTASALDLEQQRDRLERAQAELLPLEADRTTYLNALAVLTGQAPGALDTLLDGPSVVPLPPSSVPLGDPAAMVRRRPDIRAAERQYAAATAKIGVADAARFPSISFMGLIGIGGTKPGDVVDPDNLAAIALPRLSWSFLDFGRNAARVEQAHGTQDEAAAQYRATILRALQDCEDALARYGSARRSVESARRSLATAERNESLTRQRFQGQTVTRMQLLEAESARIGAAEALSQATATMSTDYVALQKALGLGWS